MCPFSVRIFRKCSACLLALLSVAVLFTACGGNSGPAEGGTKVPSSNSFTAKPRAFGNVNRVNIVADDVIIDGPVGDSVRYYYEQAYPLMPQPEALYDLQHLTPADIDKLSARRELRTYVILADLRDETSPTTQFVLRDLGEEKVYAAREDFRKGTSIVTNRWATDQLIIYLIAEGPDNLGKLVAQSFPAASKRITQADRVKLEANVYQSGKAALLPDTMAKLVGLKMELPNDYKPALTEDNVMWLRRDLGLIIQNIIVSSVPYTGQDQLSQDSVVAYRNALGKRIVRSTTPGSYMTSNDRDLPVITSVTQIDGRYAYEARGVWEMTKDFMGGPYFTYLIPDTKSGKLYIIDAFAYAPSKGKRNYMQQLEVIVRSATLAE